MSQFNVSVQDLKALMNLDKEEAIEKLVSEFNGINGLCNVLHSNHMDGLPNVESELEMRKQVFGRNVIPKKPPKSFLRLCWEVLEDFILRILIVCAIVSMGVAIYFHVKPDSKHAHDVSEFIAEMIEGGAIIFAVLLVVFITARNDWSKERKFRGLQLKIESDQLFTIIRGGKETMVPVQDLVVGDIARVKYGDLLPADGILIHGNDLKMDESALTGESDLICKSPDKDPILLSGTNAMEGSGRMIITAVGRNSHTGIIMELLGQVAEGHNQEGSDADESESSVLQTKLTVLAKRIGFFALTIAFITVVVLCIKFTVTDLRTNGWNEEYIMVLVQFVMTGVTLLVVALPEGLPLAVTLSLTYSVSQMLKDHNLVRHLDACETMGNATCICSDKTGTLTTNRMTVVQSWINGKHRLDKHPEWEDLDPRTRYLMVECISINSGYNSGVLEPSQPGGQRSQIGNKTECALLGFVLDLKQSYEEFRKRNPEESLVKVYTFNSERKSMMTVIKIDRGYRVYAKGASEILLARSNFILGVKGPKRLNAEQRDNITKNVIEKMAAAGLRTIGLAYKDFITDHPAENEVPCQENVDWDNEQILREGLTMIAIVGIQDPVRAEVPEAILKCQRAGITVRMVTGDNINTARSIAIACGIYRPNANFLALESCEFNQMIRDNKGNVDQKKLDDVWPRLRVLARAQPTDKYVLVKGIIDSKIPKNREVVAVTGDGTNDAPALKKADVGFAMGIAGTDVSKEAADIILTDDNFTSIVKAVVWGRNVYDSIAKFLQFQLTVNVVAVVMAFLSACIINVSPLKAIQMLWVNLLMDSFASLALATKKPTEELLKRNPYGRTKSIISAEMIKNIIGHALYQIVVLMILLFAGEFFIPRLNDSVVYKDNQLEKSQITRHFTMIFNCFVVMTLFNEINSRKLHGEANIFEGITKNSTFCIVWVLTFISQVIIVQVGDVFFQTSPLDYRHWIICFIFGLGELIWGQLISMIPTPNFSRDEPDYNEGNMIPEVAIEMNEEPSSHKKSRIVKQMETAFSPAGDSEHPSAITANASQREVLSSKLVRLSKQKELERKNSCNSGSEKEAEE